MSTRQMNHEEMLNVAVREARTADEVVLAAQEIANKKHKALGQALRTYRKVEGVSLRSAAKQFGVSAAFMSDIELGRRKVSESIFNKIYGR